MTQGVSSSQQTAHDFVDDFDYDYFQREPYCKTTGGSGGGLSDYGGSNTYLKPNSFSEPKPFPQYVPSSFVAVVGWRPP